MIKMIIEKVTKFQLVEVELNEKGEEINRMIMTTESSRGKCMEYIEKRKA